MALKDLQRDAKLREAYNITEDMVKFDVVPIISIPGGDPELKIEDFKNMAAVTACETMKIRDQHDKGKLQKAKKRCYLKGFESGVMLVGKFKGEKVRDAKDQERQLMIKEGKAREYWEPENLVLSRTNDKCVVAFLDQWYLTYGEEEWRDAVLKHVQSVKHFRAYVVVFRARSVRIFISYPSQILRVSLRNIIEHYETLKHQRSNTGTEVRRST